MEKCKLCDRTDIKSKELGLCSIHYARWYRKTYPERIKPKAQERYIKNREIRLQQSKDWAKINKDKVSKRIKDKYHNDKEYKHLQSVRWKTIKSFGKLKESGKCEKCGSKEKLEFHHITEPPEFNKFKILCFKCHRILHGQLFPDLEKDNFNKNRK